MKMTPAMRAWISAACAVPLLLAGGGAATAQPPAGQTPTAVQKAAPLDEKLIGVWHREEPPTNAGSNTPVKYIQGLKLRRDGNFYLFYNYRCPEPPTPCPMFKLEPIRGRYTVTALSDHSGTLTLTSNLSQVVDEFRFEGNDTLILNDGGNDQPLHRVPCPAEALILPQLCYPIY
ncbi:hypothetical protein ACIOHS_43380 [Streptomyces sp. NPDC088253]|uniref:hypothetical protein n=1 Tax=Streptomyces sp. NPDC088253 TaxID=3365846 RepID=UPI00380748F6